MLYDISVLHIYGGLACYHNLSICACGKLGPTLGFGFIQFIGCNILIIWAFKRLLMFLKRYYKSDCNILEFVRFCVNIKLIAWVGLF